MNFLECLVESMDTRWRGVKGGGKEGCKGGEPGAKGANRAEPGAKGGGKVEERRRRARRVVARWRRASHPGANRAEPGAKGGGKAEESQPAGDASCWEQGGEFASGPPPSAEPAAATSHMAAPGLGFERSLARVEKGWVWVAGSGLMVPMGGSQWGGHHGEEAQEWEPLDQK